MKEIVIGREAYNKIMYYVNKAKFEISGFGNVKVINGVPTVTDIILCKQENSSTETEMSGDAIAKALFEHTKAEMDGELKFWWHSHVNMPVFWSGQDMEAIDILSQHGWFVHGVFNKKNEVRTAYSDYSGDVDVFMDNLGLKIDEKLISKEITGIQIEYDKMQDQILTELEEVQKYYEEIIALKYKEVETEQDKEFETKVTDKTYKTYVYNGYNNNGFNFHDHNEWDVELGKYVPKQKNQAALENGITGINNKTNTETSGNVEIFNDQLGAYDLKCMGYSIEEILYMQNKLRIEDFEDIIYYENECGVDMNEVLDRQFGKNDAV